MTGSRDAFEFWEGLIVVALPVLFIAGGAAWDWLERRRTRANYWRDTPWDRSPWRV